MKPFPTALLTLTSGASAASLTLVPNYGASPAKSPMYVYVPDGLKANPAILVATHACQNSAQSTYSGTPYKGLADQKKSFLIVFPQSPVSGSCWDVSSKASLTHNGGGASNDIANMVAYATKQWSADAKRVYVVGMSSGAMMAVSCAPSAWLSPPI